jgi:Icc-related predicted phosphoesterase
MIIDCIADLHGHYPELEGGDLLIVAGDLTAKDEYEELDDFKRWLSVQNYGRKVIVAGNHDTHIERNPNWLENNEVVHLCDSGTEFEGLKIWGSPWTLRFKGQNPQAMAFTFDTEEELSKKWEMIPDDVDILVTHGPPFTILDMTVDGRQVGSPHLMAHHLSRLRPKLWIWGHIHEAYGIAGPYKWAGTRYVNASHVNELYQPVNRPIRIER